MRISSIPKKEVLRRWPIGSRIEISKRLYPLSTGKWVVGNYLYPIGNRKKWISHLLIVLEGVSTVEDPYHLGLSMLHRFTPQSNSYEISRMGFFNKNNELGEIISRRNIIDPWITEINDTLAIKDKEKEEEAAMRNPYLSIANSR